MYIVFRHTIIKLRFIANLADHVSATCYLAKQIYFKIAAIAKSAFDRKLVQCAKFHEKFVSTASDGFDPKYVDSINYSPEARGKAILALT